MCCSYPAKIMSQHTTAGCKCELEHSAARPPPRYVHTCLPASTACNAASASQTQSSRPTSGSNTSPTSHPGQFAVRQRSSCSCACALSAGGARPRILPRPHLNSTPPPPHWMPPQCRSRRCSQHRPAAAAGRGWLQLEAAGSKECKLRLYRLARLGPILSVMQTRHSIMKYSCRMEGKGPEVTKGFQTQCLQQAAASQSHSINIFCAAPPDTIPLSARLLSSAGWSQIFFSTVMAASAELVWLNTALTASELRNACMQGRAQD